MRGFAVSAAVFGITALVSASESVKPLFKPSSVNGYFVEQFTDGWDTRWSPSESTKKTASGGEVFSYVGKWSVEEASVLPSIDGDKGLVAKTKAGHHAISAAFDAPLNPKGEPLVIQYEAKFQKGGNCGGGYIKLLDSGFDPKDFNDKTSWAVMFGPDLTCPGTKVHFIFRHQNPITKEWEEKHLVAPPTPKIEELTKLYTLIINPDNTFEILIDDESVKTGNLLEDFSPSVNPPKEIDDPTDSKPEDWVDEAKIRDPDAVKPEDWDETQPFQIPDEDAVQPEDWLTDEATEIPDPEAEKPAEWDDEEDGDWQPPTVPNPKCAEASGCGPWKRPTKANPKYVGIWTAPLIDNPAYKGPWAPRKIANPDYFEDNQPANLHPVGGVGFEIWSMTEDIMFDNIYVGNSPDEAKKLAKESFHIKHAAETAEQEADRKSKQAAEKKDKPTGSVLEQIKEDPLGFVRSSVLDFLDQSLEDGVVEAFKANPQTGSGILIALLTFFGALGALTGLIGSSGKPIAKTTKKTDGGSPAKSDKKEEPKVVKSETRSKPVDDSNVKKRK